MTTHMTATRDAWLEARRDLLAAEKDLTRRSDQVAQLRRQLPWVRSRQGIRLSMGPSVRRRSPIFSMAAASSWCSTSCSRRAQSRVSELLLHG